MANVIPTLRYVWLTIRHKVFVFRAGLRTEAPLWRLLIHDWTKFTPAEAPHYGRQFFGEADDPEGFARAWLHHQNSNPHHWEYWIPRTAHTRGGYEDNASLPMPEWAVREMVADWLGASRAYEGRWPSDTDTWPWFCDKHADIFEQIACDETERMVWAVLDDVFPHPVPEEGNDG